MTNSLDSRIQQTGALIGLGTSIPMDRPEHRANIALLCEILLAQLAAKESAQ